MKDRRKLNDIWIAIDDKRIFFKMKQFEWKRSFEGIKAAIEYINLIIITTKEQLDSMEIPKDKNGVTNYMRRIIEVSKNNIIFKGNIKNILSGKNSLMTDEDKREQNNKIAEKLNLSRPKGIATTNNIESKTIDDLDNLIKSSEYIHRYHLDEHRIADIAYCMIGDDIQDNVFAADQVKTARSGENGRLTFHAENGKLTIGKMIKILKRDLCLTCIGLNIDGIVDVVWFFYGNESIDILNNFDEKLIFAPRLHLKCRSDNKLTITLNKPKFRYDVGLSKKECIRLLQERIEFIKITVKKSLVFFNEDDSQIQSETHRIEQRSMNMTRVACNKINIKVEKSHKESYGSVDFIVNGNVKVQDKVATKEFGFRKNGKLPYNPDKIDILQVSDLLNNIVYAIPMRMIKNNEVISFFNCEELMKISFKLSLKWKEDHKQFKYDLKKIEDIQEYVESCNAASKIGKLSDKEFYTRIIDENKDKFVSKKKLKDRIAQLKK